MSQKSESCDESQNDVPRECPHCPRTEEGLQKAKEEAEAANRSKSLFVAHISHEMRTPLGALLGFCELMMNRKQSERERMESLKVIKRNGDLLLQLINDLLDLSKIEADRIDVEILPLVLRDFLNEALQAFTFQAHEKGISLDVYVADDVPAVVFTDPTRLKQIISNIVGNALKFTLRGGVEIWLRVRGPNLEFEVKDSGIGLLPEQQERIWKPFEQADNSMTRRFGGTGLGLVLSKKLAIALGGDLLLKESKFGVGSSFQFWIHQSENSAHARLAPHHHPEDMVQAIRGVRILLAEDAPDNQVLISQFLEFEGAEVIIVENGEDAVRIAETQAFDLVLMDIQMPGSLDGIEATALLRQRMYQRPIVALTANAMVGERERCLHMGFDEYLTKPIDHRKLLNTIYRFSMNAGSNPRI